MDTFLLDQVKEIGVVRIIKGYRKDIENSMLKKKLKITNSLNEYTKGCIDGRIIDGINKIHLKFCDINEETETDIFGNFRKIINYDYWANDGIHFNTIVTPPNICRFILDYTNYEHIETFYDYIKD